MQAVTSGQLVQDSSKEPGLHFETEISSFHNASQIVKFDWIYLILWCRRTLTQLAHLWYVVCEHTQKVEQIKFTISNSVTQDCKQQMVCLCLLCLCCCCATAIWQHGVMHSWACRLHRCPTCITDVAQTPCQRCFSCFLWPSFLANRHICNSAWDLSWVTIAQLLRKSISHIQTYNS